MSATTYNTLTSILLTSSLIALAVAVLYLVAAIVGWRSPYRRSRLLRFFGFLVLCPALIGAQYYLLWGIFIPSMREAAEQENAVRRQERYAASSHVAIGDSAPAFELADIDGKNFSIDALRGKVVLLNFFATWCGPCLMELPRMQKLWESTAKTKSFRCWSLDVKSRNRLLANSESKTIIRFRWLPTPIAKYFRFSRKNTFRVSS